MFKTRRADIESIFDRDCDGKEWETADFLRWLQLSLTLCRESNSQCGGRWFDPFCSTTTNSHFFKSFSVVQLSARYYFLFHKKFVRALKRVGKTEESYIALRLSTTEGRKECFLKTHSQCSPLNCRKEVFWLGA